MASNSHRIAWKVGENLTHSLTCDTIVQTRVQRKGRLNPFSQDALKENGAP
jgi:hypothetical protein